MEQSRGSASEVEKVLSLSELQLMRLVICGMRAAARAASASRQTRRLLEAAACRVIARQAGKKHDYVHGLWCNFRASSLRKLRAHLARGDMSATEERLSTLEWAAVDLLLLYDTPLLSVASFHQRAQLAALERTFELVQQFQLEPENGGVVASEQWSRAAQSYSKNGVVLSAVALQRRWYELKLDTRQRVCAPQVPGTLRPLLVPIHEAVATRFPHVVRSRELLPWRRLVAAGTVAEPTSERGPAPGEPRVDAALTRDAEKYIKTIDLLDDDELEKNALKEAPINTSNITLIDTADKELTGSENTRRKSSRNRNQNKNQSTKKDISENVDIIIKPEIIEIDDDAPSPKENIIEAMQDIDLNNVDATIVYDSDEEDVKTIIDVQMGNVDKALETATVADENSEISNISEENINNSILYQEVESNWNDCQNTSNISDKDTQIEIEGHNPVKIEESSDSDENDVNCSSPDLNNQIENVGHIQEIVNNSIVCNNLDKVAEQLKDQIRAKYCAVPSAQNKDTSISTTSQDSSDIPAIDPKLLMCPLILLRRIDDPIQSLDKPLPSPSQSLNTQKSSKTSYSRLFYEKQKEMTNATPPSNSRLYYQNKARLFHDKNITRSFYEKNKTLLKQCKPCMLSLRKVDEEWGRNVGEGRKRVRLPDMEKVKRNNRGVLTAQVAPLMPTQSATMVKRVRPNSTYNDQSTPSSSTQVFVRTPLQPMFRPSVPPPWTHTSTPGQESEPKSLLEQLLVGNTYQNSSVTDPALQQNYLMIPPTQFNLLQSQTGAFLQNCQSSQGQLQNLNVPLQGFMSNPMLQEPNTNWPHGLHQNIGNNWPQTTATQNVFTNMFPPVLQTQTTMTAIGNIPIPNISTQNIVTQNIPTQNVAAQNVPIQHMAPQNIATQNITTQNISAQNVATQNIPIQNMAMQNIATENISSQNIAKINTLTQNITPQNISTQNMATQNIGMQNETSETQNAVIADELASAITTRNILTQNTAMQKESIHNIATPNILAQNIAMQNIYIQNMATQNISSQNMTMQSQTPETQNITIVNELGAANATGSMSTQNTAIQNISTQNIAMQNISSQNIVTPNTSTQNVAMQNIPTQNIVTPNISTQNIVMQNIPTQNIVTPNMSTQNIVMQNIPTQNIVTPNISTHNIETPKILIPNWGLANMAGVLSLTQTIVNQPSLTIDGTLLARSFQDIVLKQQEPLNQFITGSQPNPFIVNPVSRVNAAPTPMPMNQELNQSFVTNQALLCGSVLQIIQPTPDVSTSVAQTNAEGYTDYTITQQTPTERTSGTSVTMDVDEETNATSDGCLKTTEQVDLLQVVPVENLFEMVPNKYTYSSTDNNKMLNDSSLILDWGLFPLSPSYLMKERKIDFKHVLCTGPGQGWRLKGHLVVSDQQKPPPVAAIWSIRPRVRLQLPTPDEHCKDAKAAANVLFRDRLYQKLFDYPLTYSMMLVAVRSAAACGRLLAAGAALRLYCLRTGILHPIHAQIASFDDRQSKEIDRRIENAWKSFWSMKALMKGNLPLTLKRKLVDMCILPILTYGAQSWSLTEAQKSRLKICQRAMERSILGVRRTDRVRNTELRSRTVCKYVPSLFRKQLL
ncbi:uncharacterized protein LOC133531845 [Cydia pomonella]|uniref:uncharacterized protein LOC133531845 n=1 Tax=Cydia pomonella TaxID=82600 RepID=UPI002ADE5E79|nr:uncharacterized protein LOC133531845 [Cydia pomonella]